jgi:ribosomal protein S18 acetylase RimI-like enzyme
VVPATIRRGPSAEGLQPLRIGRDLRQVIDLIELAFGDALDSEAQRALNSMQLPAWLAPIVGLFDSLALPGEGMMPGFVWLHDGKVVGTASVRRAHTFHQGWLISNVAVHPDWQGQGIGRALLEASLEFAQDYGGSWVVLQVRDDNVVARRLYESLGFRQIAKINRFRRAAIPNDVQAPSEVSSPPENLEAARWSDGGALSALVRSQISQDVLWPDALNRDVYQTGPWQRVTNRLQGRRRRWWVQRENAGRPGHSASNSTRLRSGISAAVGIELDRRTPWHRLRLVLSPEAQDEEQASGLIAFGLGQLKDAASLPVEIEHIDSDAATGAALMESGFQTIYALVHMRLSLKTYA